ARWQSPPARARRRTGRRGPSGRGRASGRRYCRTGHLTGRSSSLAVVTTAAMAELGRRAKAASRQLATASTAAKDAALEAAADLLVDRAADVLEANAADVGRAENDGVTATVVDRLRLDRSRIQG